MLVYHVGLPKDSIYLWLQLKNLNIEGLFLLSNCMSNIPSSTHQILKNAITKFITNRNLKMPAHHVG